MEERLTQIRRDKDLSHSEVCHFHEAKGYYDNLIRDQSSHNTMVTDALTKLNDMLVERIEAVDEKTLEMQDQNDIQIKTLLSNYSLSEAADTRHEKQFQQLFGAVGGLEMAMREQKEDLSSLRKHLDNGYTDKLISRIKTQTEDITFKGNNMMATRMLDMFQIMVEGSDGRKTNKQNYFWTWLIRLTAAGGLLYILADKLL